MILLPLATGSSTTAIGALESSAGTATGIDLMLENRGRAFNTMIQYTYSEAVANGEYDQAAFGEEWVDAPSHQFLMPYDRPHDLSITLYSSELP